MAKVKTLNKLVWNRTTNSDGYKTTKEVRVRVLFEGGDELYVMELNEVELGNVQVTCAQRGPRGGISGGGIGGTFGWTREDWLAISAAVDSELKKLEAAGYPRGVE
jgi:hypothetical protein